MCRTGEAITNAIIIANSFLNRCFVPRPYLIFVELQLGQTCMSVLFLLSNICLARSKSSLSTRICIPEPNIPFICGIKVVKFSFVNMHSIPSSAKFSFMKFASYELSTVHRFMYFICQRVVKCQRKSRISFFCFSVDRNLSAYTCLSTKPAQLATTFMYETWLGLRSCVLSHVTERN